MRKSFGEVLALNDLSLNVERGSLFGLIGPDGAGKTTALRILCGLLHADAGECSVAGHDVRRNTKAVRALLGYMPQRFSLYPDLTVAENLRFFADLFSVPERQRRERTERLLDFSRLKPFMNRRAAQLSGGMKQKLALSCTLIHTPQVLLLDEPTTGVDPVSRREFWQILHDLQRDGVTLLVTTPYMDEAAKCDRIAFIHQGRILLEDAPANIPKLFRQNIAEVVADQPFAAVQALRSSGFTFAQLFGDRLHVSSDLPRLQLSDAIRRTLTEADIALISIREIQPSIEDVFVELLQ